MPMMAAWPGSSLSSSAGASAERSFVSDNPAYSTCLLPGFFLTLTAVFCSRRLHPARCCHRPISRAGIWRTCSIRYQPDIAIVRIARESCQWISLLQAIISPSTLRKTWIPHLASIRLSLFVFCLVFRNISLNAYPFVGTWCV